MLYNAIQNIVESLNLLQKIYLRCKIKLRAKSKSNVICGIILLCEKNKQRPRVLLRVSTNRLEYFNESMHFLAEELTQEYGIPEDVSTKITATYLKLFRKCPDNSTCTLDAWRMILWNKALGEKFSYLAKKIYERWLYLRYHYLALDVDIIVLLRRLRKKYLLGLITNGPSNAQWEKVRKLSLEEYFDIILVSGDLPWEKPEARIFEEACQYLNVTPNCCIMVGDKLETDILGGIEAGLGATVWLFCGSVTDKPRLSVKDPQPDFIVRYLMDLSNILNCKPGAPELEDTSSNASDGS